LEDVPFYKLEHPLQVPAAKLLDIHASFKMIRIIPVFLTLEMEHDTMISRELSTISNPPSLLPVSHDQ